MLLFILKLHIYCILRNFTPHAQQGVPQIEQVRLKFFTENETVSIVTIKFYIH